MPKVHRYRASVSWTGNRGVGTADYRTYGRDYVVSFAEKPSLAGSADPYFRGDPSHYNPEELLVASLSSCHMLWYLHLCAAAGVVVEEYVDPAEGTMETTADGTGRFTRVTLRPHVTISRGSAELAHNLHEGAHRKCFIANSVNFPIVCEPTTRSTGADGCPSADHGTEAEK